MLFDIPFIADWKKIGEHRLKLTDLNTARENKGSNDYDYKVGQKMLVGNKGILHKAQSIWQKDPWIGAVLIKTTLAYNKHEKKFHLFFLKIATYQSTPKILYVLKGNHGELKRGPKPPFLADFVQQLLHQN
jgi:hypothetical protein